MTFLWNRCTIKTAWVWQNLFFLITWIHHDQVVVLAYFFKCLFGKKMIFKSKIHFETLFKGSILTINRFFVYILFVIQPDFVLDNRILFVITGFYSSWPGKYTKYVKVSSFVSCLTVFGHFSIHTLVTLGHRS